MVLTGIERRFLQGLLADRPAVRRSQTSFDFSKHFGLGVLSGSVVQYRTVDFERAEQILQGLDAPTRALPQTASRADAAEYAGMSEKSGTRPPHADSIAVRGFGGCTLAGASLDMPFRCYAVLTLAEAKDAQADRILVVENLETFRELETYAWLPLRSGRVLAVWRGDRTAGGAEINALIQARSEPVWVFTDFDPAGLGIAQGLPRLDGLLLPTRAWLVATSRGDRGRELFFKSEAQWAPTLELATNAAVREAWTLLKELRAGVGQEGMRKATV